MTIDPSPNDATSYLCSDAGICDCRFAQVVEEISRIDDLSDRAYKIDIGPRLRNCCKWRDLVISVDGAFPHGLGIRALLDPPPQPSPKPPRRPRRKRAKSVEGPCLFEAFGKPLPPVSTKNPR